MPITLVGMDLHYTYVSGTTYTISLVAYGDCGSAASTEAFAALSSNTPQVYIYNGRYLHYVHSLLLYSRQLRAIEITPVCPADIALTQCTDISYTIPGIKKFVYTVNYTFSGTSTAWAGTVHWQHGARQKLEEPLQYLIFWEFARYL